MRVLTIALLISVTTALAANADPITDPEGVGGGATTSFEASLFDAGGLPFLMTSAPFYFQLPPHSKLRYFGGDFDNDGGGEGGAAGLFASSFISGGGAGGDGDGDPGSGDGSGGGLNALSSDGPGGGGGDLAGFSLDDGGLGPQIFIPPPAPEPATLLLLAPAAVVLRRRLARR